MQIGICTLLPHQFYLFKVQSYIFIKHFLISPILYEWTTLIIFVFLINEDFWYVVPILDITDLNICNTFIRIPTKFKTFRNVDVIRSIYEKFKSYEMRTSSPISAKF